MKKLLVTVSIFWVSYLFSGCNNGNELKSADSEKNGKANEPGGKQQPDLHGIFDFYIDKTTAKNISTQGYKYHEKTLKDIEEQVKRTPDLNDWDCYILCDGVREFDLDDFYKNGMNWHTPSLIFYHDTLIEFGSIVDYNLKDILFTKYPNVQATESGKSVTFTWNNKDIRADLLLDDQFGNSFIIKDRLKFDAATRQAYKKRAEYIKKVNSNL
jgi:hypothetical protein